jgi:DNA-binding NarL/FixJ family response regulator
MKIIRVLIVDDLPRVREGLANVLNLAGNSREHRVQAVGEAFDGYEAVRQAQRLRPDVVLMDLEMPGLDGYAATQRIKAVLPDVRVIILSIHNDAEVRQRARTAGADGYVEKGGRMEDLLSAIMSAQDTINPNKEPDNNIKEI